MAATLLTLYPAAVPDFRKAAVRCPKPSSRVISDEYHETIPGDTREWIEPDIKLTLSSRDYLANRDPLPDEVLADATRKR